MAARRLNSSAPSARKVTSPTISERSLPSYAKLVMRLLPPSTRVAVAMMWRYIQAQPMA